MAKSRIQGITIQIDGSTKGLDKALQSVNKQSVSLQNELKDVDRLLKFNPNSTTLLAQKQQLLGQQVAVTADKLKQLQNAQSQVEQQFKSGQIGEQQYRGFQRELVQTKSRLDEFKQTLKTVDDNVSLKNVEQDLKGIQKYANNAKKALKATKDELKQLAKENGEGAAQAGAAAGLGVGAATGGLVEGMQETNTKLALMRTQADAVGMSFESLNGARTNFSAIGADVDQAAESIGNLIQAGYNEEQSLTRISTALAGVSVKYGSTFNPEGLAESIGTTTHLGEVTGQFMDLLEKEGINVDSFNATLKGMSSEQERANFITQTLEKQGLTGVFNKYQQLNPEVVKNAESQQKFQQAMADLAIVLTPLVTMVTDFITKMAEFAKNNPTLTQTIVIVAGAIGALLAVFIALMPIITAISALAGVLGVSFSAVALPILAIIAVIAAVIAIGVLLYKNWDTIKAKAGEIWEAVKDAFGGLGDKMAQFGHDIIQGLIDGIKNKIQAVKDAIKSVTEAITGKVKAILDINSPSKVMAQLGKYTGEGFAIGIKSQLSNVSRQAKALSQQATTVANNRSNQSTANINNSNSNQGNTIYNFEGMFAGANFNVREEADIQKLAKQLHDYIQLQGRKGGVVF